MRHFLFVSPHPDDVELGMGGTICKLIRKKYQITIIDLTMGEPTPYGSEERRDKECRKASSILGVKKRINLKLPNRYLFDSKETRLKLAEHIRLFKPDVIFAPYPEDAHPDHIAATKITEGARFYAKYSYLKIEGSPFYPRYLFYYFCTHLRIIPLLSFVIDISPYFKDKMKAVKSYRSQFIDNPKGRFVLDYIETTNRFLGKLINAEYGEGIYSKEVIGLRDFKGLL